MMTETKLFVVFKIKAGARFSRLPILLKFPDESKVGSFKSIINVTSKNTFWGKVLIYFVLNVSFPEILTLFFYFRREARIRCLEHLVCAIC